MPWPSRDFWALFFNTPAGPADPQRIGPFPGPMPRPFGSGFAPSAPPPVTGGTNLAVPGLAVPGLATPGQSGLPPSPSGPAIVGTWTTSRVIGNGTGIPDPPTMPLELAVDNTGDSGNGLVAFVSWTLPPGYLGADMAVTDDAHGVWWPLGAPQASSSATGLTRSAIWACPGAFAAGNVYMSPCGLPSPCYPAVMGITVVEIAGMSPYLGTPLQATAVANSAGAISLSAGAPSGLAIQLAVAASDGALPPSGPGAGWTAIAGVTRSEGSWYLATTPAWQVSSASLTPAWTTGGGTDLSAAAAAILVTSPAPAQPSADWPAFRFLAGLGSGALTPPGQIAQTDLSYRWLAGDGDPTVYQGGKQYELDQLQAGENTATFDDNDGALTADNPQSPFYPDVTADVPLRLIGWWNERTYGVLAGFAERWPVSWDDEWYGITQCTIADAWSLQQNQLNGVLQEEMADPNLYALWPCSDAAGSMTAQNTAPGNTNALQVVTSKNGALTAVQAFGADSGALPGDQSGTFWSQSGLTSGAEGYGYALYCADEGYPPVAPGVTVTGWFNPVGGTTQIENTAQQLILLRAASASSGPAFQVHLESPVGANPGAICVAVWDASTKVKTTAVVESGNWLEALFFHVALLVTQGTWALWINGASAGTGTCNLPADFSWLEYMGSADRQYTGSMLNGECGDLGVYSVLLPADRIRSIYLAGSPNPQTVAGAATAVVTGAQFATEYAAQRLERLLAYGGWTGPRSISQSSVTQMAPITDIQGSTAVIAAGGQVTISSGGQEASEAAGNIVFSDGGFIFVDGNGTICYLSRGDLYVTPSQWTLGEDTPGGETPYLPTAVLGFDKSLLYNGAQLTPSSSVSGAAVVASSLPSIRAHGEYVYNATAYQYLVAQITDEASWIVNTRGVVTLRAEQLTSSAFANPDVWPFLLGVQPAQPVTVWRRPQTAAYTVQMFPVTCGVKKTLDFQQGIATAEVTTDAFPEGNVMIIGDPVRGVSNGLWILGW